MSGSRQRCAIYARFSTDKQSANSAEDQIAACSAHAERQGWTVVGSYTDIAISGASNRRPGMTAMLADAQAGAFDIVCAEAIDRIARNQADIAIIYQRLEFAGVAIDTLSEGRVNELHIGLKGTMSALFLKDLADKIRRGQRGTVERGRVPGGLAYGYEVVPTIGADGDLDRGHRRINEDQARVVRRIYAEYLSGRSPKAIAKDLNRDGVPAPRGKEWRASSIAGSRARGVGVLHNPIYAGRYRYNRVRMVRDPESRRRVSRVNAADQWVEVDMPELAIVDRRTWQRVQDEGDLRSQGPIVTQRRPRYLLTGLVRCGGCGGAMVLVVAGRYGCNRHREAGTCDVSARISREELEARVLKGISEALLAPDAVSRMIGRYHAELQTQSSARTETVASIDRRIGKLDKAIARLVDAIAEGSVVIGEIREALIARKAERETLLRRRDEAEAIPVIAMNPKLVESYRARVRKLALVINAPTPNNHEVVSRLRDLIERVKVTPLNDGAWSVEVLTSLGGVVSLAKKEPMRRRLARGIKMVAEEGLEPPTRGL